MCAAALMIPAPAMAQGAATANLASAGSTAASSFRRSLARSRAAREASAASNAAMIPPGTKITMANWRRYERFMPDGMVKLFEGTRFWKMPADVEIDVGPTRIYSLPRGYLEATEKYGGQTRVVVLPNGHYGIGNYIAGEPFPQPAQPYKGWKILADDWFGPIPRIAAGSPETGLASLCMQNKYGLHKCMKVSYVYRKLAFITEPGYPRTEAKAGGAWYTEWQEVERPEQLKYSAMLQIFYKDLERPEDDYMFVPALRRSMRLGTTSRCKPLFGTDFTHDDARAGFNGSIAIFQAKWLRDQKILALTDLTGAAGLYPDNYDTPLGWARPSWGRWSLRDTYVIDVRRIPSEAAGYCYGKRVMYVDKDILHELWTDLYDSKMRLWKVMAVAGGSREIQGHTPSSTGTLATGIWDFRREHATLAFTADGDGRDTVINEAVPVQYRSIPKYCTPAGLKRIAP